MFLNGYYNKFKMSTFINGRPLPYYFPTRKVGVFIGNSSAFKMKAENIELTEFIYG